MQFKINECFQFNNTYECRNDILMFFKMQSSNCNINGFKSKIKDIT